MPARALTSLLTLLVLSLATPARAMVTRAPLAGPTENSEERWPVLWPIRTCGAPEGQLSQAQRFFSSSRTSVLDGFSLSAWDDRATLLTELVRDTGICWFSLALGGAISRVDTGSPGAAPVEQREAVQRLVTSGGNLSLKGQAPVIYRRADTADRNTWAGLFLAPRLGLDIPAVSQTRDFAGSVDLGLEAQGTYTTDGGKFSFLGLLRASWVTGTGNWADALRLERRSAGLTEAVVGVSVADYVSVRLTFLLDAPRPIRQAFPGTMLTFTSGPGLAASAGR